MGRSDLRCKQLGAADQSSDSVCTADDLHRSGTLLSAPHGPRWFAAELLASTKGLGFMIQQARGIFRLDIIIVGMIVIAITGAVLSSIIQFYRQKTHQGR